MAGPGNPKTGGRVKGAKNKTTLEREAAVAEAMAKAAAILGDDAFDGDAHALLITIYKDPRAPLELRVHCAQACLPYEKPRLAAIEHTGKDGAPIAHTIEERRAAAAALITEKFGTADA